MAKAVDEKARRAILQDNLWKVVFSITIPLFLYQFMNSFYTLVDQIMVASIGDSSVSAVATISQIKALISSFGAGLAAGGAIVVSRLYGSGNIEESKKNANVLFSLSLLIIGFIILLMPFSTSILRLAQVPDDLIKISKSYFLLQLFEQIIIVINNVFIGLEKSKGNTKIIFIGNLIIMGVKLLLNSFFVYILKVDSIVWIEIASIIAQSSMMGIGLYYLFRKKNIFRIEFRLFSLKMKYVKPILLISLPLFLGKFVISLGKVSVNAMCKKYGALTVGALGISNNICGLISNAGNAIEDSESSIVSQNLGNKNMKRTLKTFFVSCAIIFSWNIVGFISVRFLFQDQLINLFNTKNTSEEFVVMIKNIFYYDCLSIPALAINSVILGLLYGYGQTVLSTINNILRISTRIGVLWFLQTYHPELGSEAAGISMGISNVAIAIFSTIFLIVFLIITCKKGYKGMHYNDEEPTMHIISGILTRIEKEEIIQLNDLNEECKGNLKLYIHSYSLPTILICPGGGYSHLSTREDEPVSDKFLDLGYNTAILHYTVGEDLINNSLNIPTPLIEINESIKYIKSLSKNLILLGFSAGGHLAGLGATDIYKNEVDGAILCYPVITLGDKTHLGTKEHLLGKNPSLEEINKYSIEKRVDSSTPPMFVWASKLDEAVPYENTLMLIEALKKYNVPFDFKIFNTGKHGLALADETAIKDGDTTYVNEEVRGWPSLADNFIKKILN